MAVKNIKRQNLLRLFLLLSILIVLNILGGYVFSRIDMTQEKRYTLSESSKQLAKNLKDIVYFKIYLDGELPPGFNKLKKSFREMLDEFRVYGGDNIAYEFIDPSSNPVEKERFQLYKQLSEKGLYPTTLEQKEQSGESQKIIFPGAIVNYRSKEFPMQILKSRMGSSPEQMLNISVENLEYEICSMLRKITLEKGSHIGFLQGQNELSSIRITDAARALSEFYDVDTVSIDGKLNALKEYNTIIIAGPDTAFNERDKFIIDQFIMHGGSVFWLLDKVQINIDSLSVSSTTIALPNQLNIDEMLFKYGVRINTDLLMDMQAAPVPVIQGYVGNQPKTKMFPWYYFPLFQTTRHPIVFNLNTVKAEFASSIDTIETEDVKKTVLLSTGKFSRLQMTPARVSMNMLRDEPDPRQFNKQFITSAVLLEGKFSSNYENRIPDQLAAAQEIDFKSKSVPTSMIVAGDADIIANYVSKKGNIYPLGYDRYSGQNYGNRNFILNCVDYLCGNKDILELRGKEFKLRLLDPAKMENKTSIRLINILIPSAMILIFSFLFTLFKKRKFEK